MSMRVIAATPRLASFGVQVDAAVEAATESKLARIMAVDSSKDGYVPRRVRDGGNKVLGAVGCWRTQ